MKLDAATASRMAGIVLGHVTREYPNKLDHVLLGDDDALPPRKLHPIFFGSFDWHSCVHGWWTLLTLRRLFPDIPEAEAITTLADNTFTSEKVAAELAYLDRPMSGNEATSLAFRAARALVFEGVTQPNGYTEPLLHRFRQDVKRQAV